uniref:Methyltransferase domain-containing protein n=1 Tax=Panagrolaimus sp. PS1159 TaxID=55785 RepID=A0AC35GJ22_9BILA
MFALNRDILEEIVPHFNVWNFNEDKSVEQIENFMLSGKEPYEATLRFFSHADTVVIAPNAVQIVVIRHTLRVSDGNNLYKFPYDFRFLNDILGALKNSHAKLEIEYYPYSAAGRKVLAHLTQKKLKFVSFDDTDDLPSDYYKFFKNECSFDDLHLDLCCVKNPTLSEFFELTSKHRSITTHFEYFSQKMAKGYPFPAVESLSFHPCFCEEDFEDFPFVFTAKGVKTFSTLLVERTIGDGGKWSIFYSLGLNNEISFDLELMELIKNQCKNIAVDMDEQRSDIFQQLPYTDFITGTISHRSNETLDEYTLEDLMTKYNTSTIDILKMDIEGLKFNFFVS